MFMHAVILLCERSITFWKGLADRGAIQFDPVFLPRKSLDISRPPSASSAACMLLNDHIAIWPTCVLLLNARTQPSFDQTDDGVDAKTSLSLSLCTSISLLRLYTFSRAHNRSLYSLWKCVWAPKSCFPPWRTDQPAAQKLSISRTSLRSACVIWRYRWRMKCVSMLTKNGACFFHSLLWFDSVLFCRFSLCQTQKWKFSEITAELGSLTVLFSLLLAEPIFQLRAKLFVVCHRVVYCHWPNQLGYSLDWPQRSFWNNSGRRKLVRRTGQIHKNRSPRRVQLHAKCWHKFSDFSLSEGGVFEFLRKKR